MTRINLDSATIQLMMSPRVISGNLDGVIGVASGAAINAKRKKKRKKKETKGDEK